MHKALDDDLVMTLVERALAKPRGERDAYIAETCAGDFDLTEQVRNYVHWEETMDGFLLEPFCLSPEPVFEAGDLLADRFRVLKMVGEGGMGVVYKAMDEWLGKVVALKCARNGFDERLRSEVIHASEIAHPNVCKIFDIHTSSTPDGSLEFITMEFLEGETLAERLLRAPLRTREARDIGRQISAGLAEAHRHGVVHGDLKSNNVILVPDPGKGRVRAVITDFGLARGLPHPEGPGLGRFASAPVGGAPDYMAAELFQGQKPTPASDVYALGVVLLDLTCGRRPSGTSPKKSQRLRTVTALYGKWDRIETRCLDRDPARRFQTAVEVEEKLKVHDPPPSWVLAAAALLACLVGVVTYRVVTAPGVAYALAMLPIESSSAELAPLAKQLSLDTAKQLAKIKGDRNASFTFIPLDRVRQKGVDSFDKAYAKLHATHVLRIRLNQESGKMTAHAVLLDARSGLPLPCVTALCSGYGGANEWTPRYAPGEQRHAPVALAGMVTAMLKLPPLRVAAVNSAARTDYETGTQEARQNSTLASAIPRLEQAVKEDPDSPLTSSALAEARWFQFRYTNGRAPTVDQIKESLFISESLNPDTAIAHRVEGYLFYNVGLYGNAEAEFARAIALEPGNAMAHIWLAKALEDNNQPDAAEKEFLRATEVEPQYFRTFQNLGAFYQDRSNYENAARNLQIAVAFAPESEKPTLHGFLGAACTELGEFRASRNEYRLSLSQHNSVRTHYNLGQTLMYDRDDAGAIVEFRQALDLLKSGNSAEGTSKAIDFDVSRHCLSKIARGHQGYGDEPGRSEDLESRP